MIELIIPVIAIVVLLCKIHHDNLTLKRVKRDLFELSLAYGPKSIESKSEGKLTNVEVGFKLDGLFEVHITVDPRNDYFSLLHFVKNHKSKSMKIIYAVSNARNNQYMISYFSRKDNEKIVINQALTIASEMDEANIKVIRVKVEGHGAINTPMTQSDYFQVKRALNQKYDFRCGVPYFEFHVKVGMKKDAARGSLDCLKLEKAIESYGNVGISYNLCSSSVDKKPLLTIRVYDEGLTGAQLHKDNVMNALKVAGYMFEDNIQQEFCIFDTCTSLDDG